MCCLDVQHVLRERSSLLSGCPPVSTAGPSHGHRVLECEDLAQVPCSAHSAQDTGQQHLLSGAERGLGHSHAQAMGACSVPFPGQPSPHLVSAADMASLVGGLVLASPRGEYLSI